MPDYETLDSLRDNGDFHSYMVTAKHDTFDNRNSDYCLWLLKVNIFSCKASSNMDFKSRDTKDSLASGMYSLNPFKQLHTFVVIVPIHTCLLKETKKLKYINFCLKY